MTATPEIRPESATDYHCIASIVRQAFGQEGEATLVSRLRTLPEFDPRLSLVAVQAEKIVGHVLFTPIHIEGRDGSLVGALALAPLAVEPSQQRTGIGTQLVRAGLTACKQRSEKLVIVVGHPDYYPRFGFRAARAFGLEVPFPVSDEAFMALDLAHSGAGEWNVAPGMVRYPAPFLEL